MSPLYDSKNVKTAVQTEANHHLGGSIILHATPLAKEVGVLRSGKNLAQKHYRLKLDINVDVKDVQIFIERTNI